MTAFYNERDPYAAQWLRNLIDAGEIAPGVVDERDIRDIAPGDLAGFTQCHFFAGIGVWSRALRCAGWPDDRPVWTGSCPCQPFSAAGQRAGFDDERHLWPHWHWLVDQCRPAVVFGEQVASKDGLGWVDLVSADLETSGYAFGAADLCAAGFGGAHIRQRLYFVGLADADHARLEGWFGMSERAGECAAGSGGVAGGLADTGRKGRQQKRADAGRCSEGSGQEGLVERPLHCGNERPAAPPLLGRHPADWLFCRDGKWKPVEPGAFPLADAAAARVGRLRAYGNALDAETAQGFIEAVTPLVPPLESAAA